MKFLRPNIDTKLEGYILGYGGSMFSKQFIQLPENGKPYENEFGKRREDHRDACVKCILMCSETLVLLDAEPKYLIAVQPIPTNDVKKHCTGDVSHVVSYDI